MVWKLFLLHAFVCHVIAALQLIFPQWEVNPSRRQAFATKNHSRYCIFSTLLLKP